MLKRYICYVVNRVLTNTSEWVSHLNLVTSFRNPMSHLRFADHSHTRDTDFNKGFSEGAVIPGGEVSRPVDRHVQVVRSLERHADVHLPTDAEVSLNTDRKSTQTGGTSWQ